MAGLLVACAKGCGELIEVTEDVLEEAKKGGPGLVVSHERCPNEPGVPFRRFKIVIDVLELLDEDICRECDGKLKPSADGGEYMDHIDQEPPADGHVALPTRELRLASIGHEEQAVTFTAALPKLQDGLNNQWGRVVGLSRIVDSAQGSGPDDGQPA